MDRSTTDQELRASEGRFRAFFDHAADAFFLLDERLNVLDVNRQACANLGYDREELIGKHPRDFDAGLDEAAIAALSARVRTGETITFESVHRRKDGSQFPVEIRVGLLEDGGRVHSLCIARDVTDRKRAEERTSRHEAELRQGLARSEACLAEAQRLTKTGSWTLDPGGQRPRYWSAEMFRIWGFDPAKGIPPPEATFTRVHPDDFEQSRGHFERALALAVKGRASEDAETVDVVEVRLVMPDGTLKHVRSAARAILDDAGRLIEYVGANVDITEQKHAEEALRASEGRFRMFVDHATDAFFLRDRSARKLIDVNRQACATLGYTREELIGMRPEDFDPNVDARFVRWFDEQLARGEIFAFESRHRRKDGSTFPVEVRARAFSQGDRRFVLSLARDISERKHAEAERERLRQLESELAHINRVSMVGEMVASIAHEISQPLAALISNAGACRRWLAGNAPRLDRARETADWIVHEAERAGEIVDRVRALVKKVGTPRSRLDLNDSVREVLALVADEAKSREVVIQTDFASDLAPVLADRVQVQQVVLNLVMNAIDAMRETAVRRLVVSTRNDDDGQVRVAVRDTGKGLDPTTLERMFDAFYSTKPGGMGMGLSISRSIVQSHAGRMWAAPNDDGTGAAVQFTVPRYEE